MFGHIHRIYIFGSEVSEVYGKPCRGLGSSAVAGLAERRKNGTVEQIVHHVADFSIGANGA